MSAPLTKQEIHRRIETLHWLILALKTNTAPDAQAETLQRIEQHLADLLGDLYEDIARELPSARP